MISFILSIPFLIIFAYWIYAGFKYTRMIGRIFSDLVFMPEERFSSAAIKGEEITLVDPNHEKINLLKIEKKGSNKVVIFCSESGESKESWEKYAYFFPQLGFQVVSMDFTDYGNSEERNHFTQWPLYEETRKLSFVIDWVKKSFGLQEVQIVLFGVSKGADIVFAALSSDPAVKGVITDGLFSMHEVFGDYIRKWAPILVRTNLFGENYPDWVVAIFSNLGFWYSQKICGKKFIEVKVLLKKHHPPLLMIHGKNDEYVSEFHQKALEKNYKNCSVFHRLIVENARHNAAILVEPRGYVKKVSDFLLEIGLIEKI